MSNKDNLREAALEYHRLPKPGKIEIRATKALENQRDLALAYSPGVAFACEEIEKDPLKALDYTSRGNLVAVISNGTAVLGLGNIGALASKPVMEGKSVLFKKFANIDSIDIEIDQLDVDKLVEAIASLEPSFGGINLEDIKAPECFEVESRLRERMNIPVFHDDQHGTAIIVAAAFTNWLLISGRKIDEIKLVANGAGAAAIACLNLLVHMGVPRDNIAVCDRDGVVYKGRTNNMDPIKAAYAIETNARSLDDVIEGADVFLGLSAADTLSQDMVRKMTDAPLIMALSNPRPEIMPELAREVKPNAIICTGRSDYPNQVNNVLCFPFIFRGALDVGATAINEEMKIAVVHAIAELARREVPPEVSMVYAGEELEFGPNYMIPKPFDPRLISTLPVAVAKAAMDTGVATRPIENWEAYTQLLQSYTYRTSMVMRPLFDAARKNPKRVVYAEGEEEKVLRAVQTVIDDGLAHPILIGRRAVVQARVEKLGLRMQMDKHFDLVDPEEDHRYREYWTSYHELMSRRGVTEPIARTTLRTNNTVIGALMIHKGEADAMLCGIIGQYQKHLKDVVDILGLRSGVETPAAMNALVNSKGAFFITDTQVNPFPSTSQIAEVTLLAADEIRRFGIKPKAALLSHSDFGNRDSQTASNMRNALSLIRERDSELEIDGEMNGDCALSEKIRKEILPNSSLTGSANLLVMPTLDAANITFNTMKVMTDAISIGPVLLGLSRPAHILTPAVSPRGIANMTAVAVSGAQEVEADPVAFARAAE
jgi:malate dehydrogenase (oxaloacetate-decarboxylating)(NADP+)